MFGHSSEYCQARQEWPSAGLHSFHAAWAVAARTCATTRCIGVQEPAGQPKVAYLVANLQSHQIGSPKTTAAKKEAILERVGHSPKLSQAGAGRCSKIGGDSAGAGRAGHCRHRQPQKKRLQQRRRRPRQPLLASAIAHNPAATTPAPATPAFARIGHRSQSGSDNAGDGNAGFCSHRPRAPQKEQQQRRRRPCR